MMGYSHRPTIRQPRFDQLDVITKIKCTDPVLSGKPCPYGIGLAKALARLGGITGVAIKFARWP